MSTRLKDVLTFHEVNTAPATTGSDKGSLYFHPTTNRLQLTQHNIDAADVITRSDIFTATVSGIVPPSGGGTTNFLRADGTWAAAGTGTVDGTGATNRIAYWADTDTLTSNASLTFDATTFGGPDGTAAAMGIGFTSDTNLGLFRRSADALGVRADSIIFSDTSSFPAAKASSQWDFQKNTASVIYVGVGNGDNAGGAGFIALSGVGNDYASARMLVTSPGSTSNNLPGGTAAFMGAGNDDITSIQFLTSNNPGGIGPPMIWGFNDFISGSREFLRITDSLSTRTVVFNENANDQDFRAESQTNPNMFFVDASTDRVGIGTNTPDVHLDVEMDLNTFPLARFKNLSTGTSAAAALEVINDNGNANARLVAFGSNNSNTTFTTSVANATAWLSEINTSRMIIATQGMTAPIEIGTASNTQGLRSLLIGANVGIVTINPDSSTSIDFNVKGNTNANLLYVDVSTDRVGIGTAVPDARVDIVAGTIPTTKNALKVSGTLTDSGGTEYGILTTITSAGSAGTGFPVGWRHILDAGYTGARPTAAVFSTNNLVTSASGFGVFGTHCNSGLYGQALGSGTGNANVGILGYAEGSTAFNIGALTQSYINGSGTNIGNLATASNGTGFAVAGFYQLRNGNAGDPSVSSSAALLADNGSVAADIFVARDGGTVVVDIPDGGGVRLREMAAPGTPTTDFGVLYTKTDGKVYWKNDGGTEYDLTAGVGSGPGTIGGTGSANQLAYFTDSNTLASSNGITINVDELTLANPFYTESSVHVNVSFANSNTTLGDSQYVVRADASTAAFTVTLPAAGAGVSGRIYVIKKVDSTANVITIDGNGSETIDGALTQSLVSQYQSLTIVSTGNEWNII